MADITPTEPPVDKAPGTTEPKATDTTGVVPSLATVDRWLPQFIVTVVLLVGFAGLVGFMLAAAGTSSSDGWERRIYIFASAEAIVFTSVGWLFGREVHRSEAKTAKKDAETAKGEKADAEKDAKVANDKASEKTAEAAAERAKGKAVKALVQSGAADLVVTPVSDGGAARPVGLNDPEPILQPSPLRRLVDDLWPD